MGIPFGPVLPGSVVSQGEGIVWSNPALATGTGIGTIAVAFIIGFSITSNVVSFTTNPQGATLTAGQQVVISRMLGGTYLNGVTLTVLPTGLSNTTFSANFTHANVASTSDLGVVTPTSQYAFANYNQAVTPPIGQYVTYTVPTGPDPTGQAVSGGCINLLPGGYVCTLRGGGGTNGCFSAPLLTATSTGCQAPTLPTGAVVQAIYPVAMGTTAGSTAQAFKVNYPTNQSFQFTLNGAVQVGPNLGTNLSVLSNVTFTFAIQSTLATAGPPYYYESYIPYFAVAVVYSLPSGGTPTPANQLQTLAATNFTISIPESSRVSGVKVDFATGDITGGGNANLAFQLTLNGAPIGTSKPFTTANWATNYSLGGDGDTWGAGQLSWSAVNGSNKLGVNVSGTLANGAQVNFNNLSLTVYSLPNVPRVWVNVGNTRTP